jgi:hypothetical protein
LHGPCRLRSCACFSRAGLLGLFVADATPKLLAQEPHPLWTLPWCSEGRAGGQYQHACLCCDAAPCGDVLVLATSSPGGRSPSQDPFSLPPPQKPTPIPAWNRVKVDRNSGISHDAAAHIVARVVAREALGGHGQARRCCQLWCNREIVRKCAKVYESVRKRAKRSYKFVLAAAESECYSKDEDYQECASLPPYSVTQMRRSTPTATPPPSRVQPAPGQENSSSPGKRVGCAGLARGNNQQLFSRLSKRFGFRFGLR